MIRVTNKSKALAILRSDAALATPSFSVLGFDEYSSRVSSVTGNMSRKDRDCHMPFHHFCSAKRLQFVSLLTERLRMLDEAAFLRWRPLSKKKRCYSFSKVKTTAICTAGVWNMWQLVWLVTDLYLYTLSQMLLNNNTQNNWYRPSFSMYVSRCVDSCSPVVPTLTSSKPTKSSQ